MQIFNIIGLNLVMLKYLNYDCIFTNYRCILNT